MSTASTILVITAYTLLMSTASTRLISTASTVLIFTSTVLNCTACDSCHAMLIASTSTGTMLVQRITNVIEMVQN